MLSLVSILFSIFSSNAFLIATLDSSKVDPSLETDVIVVGYAGELGSGFLQTALTYAHKTREQYPQRQIVFYVENRTKDGTASANVKKFGAQVHYFDATPFTATKLMKELKAFIKIHTLHVVSHSALENGAGLTDQTTEGRWNSKTPGLSELQFTEDGYIVLHGCNTGFLQAPEWSRIIGVPVFGSLNATNFQQPFNDGEWYFHDKILFPVGAKFLKENSQSFFDAVPCANGGCFRLKPDYFPYNGFWGDFGGGGGLSFLKTFCTFEGGAVAQKQGCLKAMRQWIQIFPSHLALGSQPSLEEYKAVVKDYLCGIHREKPIRDDCYKNLEASESNPSLVFAGFVGNVLKCDNFGPCDVTYKCNNANHNCVLSAPKNKKPTTIVEEYHHYLEAF